MVLVFGGLCHNYLSLIPVGVYPIKVSSSGQTRILLSPDGPRGQPRSRAVAQLLGE